MLTPTALPAPLVRPLPATALRHWFRAVLVVLALGFMLALPSATSADPGDVGFQDMSGVGAGAAPSGSKPESKLWHNDGFWWGSLYDVGTSDFYIWKLDLDTNVWTRTNTRLDDRNATRADTLWDGTKLYVASHQFSESDGSGTSRLYRLSYNSSTDTYTHDGGFPQTINAVRSETLVIAKDSTGQLWATWERGSTIWVNRTTSGDSTWGTPFALPGSPSVGSDDISTIIAFGGNKVGVMFSDQSNPDAFYFVVHDDSAADTAWNAPETAYAGNNFADDHINLKTDASGRVFAAVKTSLSGSSPLIVLLVRSTGGTWTNTTIGTGTQDQTRPILIIDETNQLLRVYSVDDASGGAITEETSPLGSISFPSGEGTVVIKDFDVNDINNPSSTKQTITSATGLVVVAFNDTTDAYWHATILGGGGPVNAPPSAGATSATTPLDTPVAVALSGTDAETCELSFSIVSGPAHGSLGPITDAGCTAGSPNADGASVTYTPTAAYSGPDSFTYRVNDGTTDSSPATATLTVQAGPDSTAPVHGTPAVNGASLTIPYNEALDTGSQPAGADFAVLVNSVARTVNSAVVAGSGVTLTLASPVVSTDTVTLGYSPGTNPVQDVAGNDAVSFGPVGVTNNTPPPGPTTQTFNPVADAQVKSTSATTNYGADTTFRLREEAGGVIYHSYVRFTVTGLSGPATSVKLRLFVTDSSNAVASVYTVANGWIETGAGSLTWNNRPVIGGTALGGGAPTPVGQWLEINLGTAGITANGTYSFGLKTT
ncbi:MAG: CBM96 family carbohydrate-binding protein, partial [Candidatus Limnocylindrales bacterium]